MNMIQAYQYVTGLEEKYKDEIAKISLFGFNIWTVFRLKMLFEMCSDSRSQKPDRNSWLFDFKALLTYVIKGRGRIILRVSTKYGAVDNGILQSNKIKEIVSTFGKEKVLVVGDVGYREVEYYRNRKIIPHIDLPINIVARLTPYLGKVLYFLSIAKVYALRRAKFFKEIGIGCKNAEKTISTLAAGFFLYYIFYGLIRPSHFLYLIASYGNEAETLVLKKMKVPVFEYQHGYSFPEQPGYSYSRCLHPLKAKMVIPDKYLWYGKYWEDALVLNGFYAKENIKVIGHPNLSIMKDAEKNKNCILVAAQTGSNEQFMNFLHNYIDRSAYAKNKCFIVKCHPRETAYYIKMWHDFSAKYPDKVKISTESTYKLLMRCHVMLTGTSTVLFEGLYFNCTAYIFTNYLMKHKSSIWKDEFATIIDESYIGDLVPRNISSEMAKTISLMWAPFNGRMLRETLSCKII